jgi:hypothetical protein
LRPCGSIFGTTPITSKSAGSCLEVCITAGSTIITSGNQSVIGSISISKSNFIRKILRSISSCLNHRYKRFFSMMDSSVLAPSSRNSQKLLSYLASMGWSLIGISPSLKVSSYILLKMAHRYLSNSWKFKSQKAEIRTRKLH